jgi:hypothetical protein
MCKGRRARSFLTCCDAPVLPSAVTAFWGQLGAERRHCRSLRGASSWRCCCGRFFHFCSTAQCRGRRNRLRLNLWGSFSALGVRGSPPPRPRKAPHPTLAAPPLPPPCTCVPGTTAGEASRAPAVRGARALRPPSLRVLVPAAAAARLFSPLRASRVPEEEARRRRRQSGRRAPAGARAGQWGGGSPKASG